MSEIDTEKDEELGTPVTNEEVEDLAADEVLSSQDIVPETYGIIAYGADFDVTSLVKRIQSGDIVVPEFQRGFVWPYRQAARFIESLLLGLPVPGIFLWRDPRTERLVVIDGLQRLKTLEAFYEGVIRGKEFTLPEHTSPYQKVHPRFQERTYRSLDEEDRRRLDNSIIHATIVNQERPPGDYSSLYYLFERINTEGTPLQAQEIRAAIYPGPFIELLRELNSDPEWRDIYGPESPRLKDQELILRFFALYYSLDTYARPMKEFLNTYLRNNQELENQSASELRALLDNTIAVIHSAIGKRAFRLAASLNAAIYDAVMVGTAKRLANDRPIGDEAAFRRSYEELLRNTEFLDAVTRATADAESVRKRIEFATAAFADVA
jgi:hypothetical protein